MLPESRKYLFDIRTAIDLLLRFTDGKTYEEAGFLVVNRLENVGAIGGCTDTNEFNWLLQKVARALGIVHLEQQARI